MSNDLNHGVKPSLFSSLRARLILLLLLVLFAAAGVIVIGFIEHQKLDRKDAGAEALRLTQLVATSQENTLEATGRLLGFLANLPTIQQEDREACRTLLAGVLDVHEVYANLALVNIDGRVIAEARTTNGNTRYPVGDIAEVARTQEMAVSGYAVDPGTGRPCVLVAAANRNAPARHLVVAAIDIDTLNPVTATNGLPEGSVLTMLDRHGRVLLRSLEPEKWSGHSEANMPTIKRLIRTRQEMTEESAGLDGVIRIWGYAPIHVFGDVAGYIGVGIPSSVIYADANRVLYRSLLFLALITAGTLALAWYGSSAVVLRRVHNLLMVTQRIAAGDLEARTDISDGSDEIGRLSKAMGEMATSIANRENNLRTTQEALREGEARYHQLFDTNPLPALAYDTETLQFLAVNEAALHCYGYSREEFLGMTVLNLRPAEGIATLHGPDRLICDLGEDRDAAQHQTANGSVIFVEANGHDLVLSGRPARLVLVHEITAKVEAERALRESEERFRRVFEDGPFGMVISDLSGHILQANPALCQMLGFSLDEMRSRTIFQITHPDDLRTERRETQRVLSGEVPSYTIEKRFVKKDGSVEWGNWTLAVFRDGEGEPRFALGMAEDIGDRKLAESRLKESVQQLRDLARRLAAVREEERTGIAREVHDELGQTLTGLKMDLSFLRADIGRTVDDDNKKSVLLNRIEGMATLIDSTVQTVRRIATELRPAVLDTLGLIPAIEWQLQDFERRTHLRTSFRSSLPDLTLGQEASTSVFRIFQETLTNVARHSRASCVSVKMEEMDGTVELRITDDGIGMTRTELAHAGSLGLLGMRERALVIGGTVDIESTPGTGTVVTVLFPIDGKAGSGEIPASASGIETQGPAGAPGSTEPNQPCTGDDTAGCGATAADA